jgi:hypothetical protein
MYIESKYGGVLYKFPLAVKNTAISGAEMYGRTFEILLFPKKT